MTHTISGIDIALSGPARKGDQPAGRAAAGGPLRDRVRPYASLLMDQPERLAAHLPNWSIRVSGHSRSVGDLSAATAERWMSPSCSTRGMRMAPTRC